MVTIEELIMEERGNKIAKLLGLERMTHERALKWNRENIASLGRLSLQQAWKFTRDGRRWRLGVLSRQLRTLRAEYFTVMFRSKRFKRTGKLHHRYGKKYRLKAA